MEPQDLVHRWHEEPKYPLTPRQISIRLPIDVAAKVAALCEIYPARTKTEIIADLVASSVDQLARALPSEKGDFLEQESTPGGIRIYRDVGPKGRFLEGTARHLRQLEEEVGHPEQIPVPLPHVRML
jgi:hypothetical protein